MKTAFWGITQGERMIGHDRPAICVATADFTFLVTTLGLTKGDLSSHVDKLEQAGYVRVNNSFQGKLTNAQYELTPQGRQALDQHRQEPDRIRAISNGDDRGARP